MLLIMTKKNEKKSPRSHQGQRLSALWLCFLMFVFGYLAASWFDVNQFVKWVGDRFSGQPAVKKVIPKTETTVSPIKEQHPKLEFYTLLTNDAGLHSVQAQLDSSNTTHESTQQQTEQKKPNKTSSIEPSSGPMELALTAPSAELPAKPTPSPFSSQESTTPAKTVAPAKSVLPKPVTDELKPAPNPTPITANDKYKGRYVIQVASFRSQSEAIRLREKLAQRRYNVYIVPVMQQSTYWYRVMVGPFSSLGQAQQMQSALSYREHIRGIIRKD